ncbi:MAG TPA: ABC transporter permease [Kiritimatiellia bacterium]|nr:ABC transporter permease [Kiritimatiellia bacterium]
MNSVGTYERMEQETGVEAESRLARIYRYRFALYNLIMKDFKVRYRNMSLGILWSLLNPLIMLGVLVVVFSYIHPSRHAHFFPVFLLIGMTTYNFFSLCMPPATAAILENASLVKKVIFPRVLIPVSVILSQFIHLLIQVCLLTVFVLAFRVPLHFTILWVPLIYLVLLTFIMGMAFACSALNVFYRDILYLVQSSLTVMFWLTPIFYDLAQVKLNLPRPLYLVYILNPIAGCIDGLRNAILRGKHPDPESMGVAAGVALFALGAGIMIFRSRQKHFSDKI